MEDRNTSTTTNESLREAGKQSNPVMFHVYVRLLRQ